MIPRFLRPSSALAHTSGYLRVEGEVDTTPPKLPANLVFAPLDDAEMGSGDITLVATSDSPAEIEFTTTTPALVSITGTIVTLLDDGVASIRARQSANEEYASASVTRTFTITRIPVTLVIDDIPDTAIDQSPITLDATSNSPAPIVFTTTTPARVSISGDTATLLSEGSASIGASQAKTGNYAAATATPETFTILEEAGEPEYEEPDYANFGGTGDRRPDARVSYTGAGSGGFPGSNNTPTRFFNGDIVTNNNYFSGASDYVITWDYGFGNLRRITEFRLRQQYGASHGTWAIEASNDASVWTTLSSFALGAAGAVTEYPFTNPNAYRYYRLRQVSGASSNGPYVYQFEFKIADHAPTAPRATNSGGQGNRSGSITVTTDATLSEGTASNLVDGEVFNNGSDAIRFPGGESGKFFKFDFATARVINKLFLRNDQPADNGTFDIEGSNDDSSWTTIASGLAWYVTDPYVCMFFNNTTAYRYYRLSGPTTGTLNSAPYLMEVEFAIGS